MFLHFHLLRKESCRLEDKAEVDRNAFQLLLLTGLKEIFSDPFHSTPNFGLAVVETQVGWLVPEMDVYRRKESVGQWIILDTNSSTWKPALLVLKPTEIALDHQFFPVFYPHIYVNKITERAHGMAHSQIDAQVP